MIIVRDEEGHVSDFPLLIRQVFGGFASNLWRKTSAAFYGDDKCFLFSLKPKHEFFHATKADKNFMHTDDKGLAMGGTEKGYGLWLDSDLLRYQTGIEVVSSAS